MTATLDTIAKLLQELITETRTARLVYEAHQAGPVAPVDDEEDQKIAFDPKTWRGQSYKGSHYSDCPAEYLDHVARAMTNIARDEREKRTTYKDKPAYIYSLQKAGRARRWALRKRLGWEKPKAAPLTETKAAPFGGSAPFGTPKPAAVAEPEPKEDATFNFGANVVEAGDFDDDEELPI